MVKNNLSNKFNKFFFSGFRLYRDIYKASKMVDLSNGKHLIILLLEIGRIFTNSIFLKKSKLTSRIRMIHNFGMKLIRMNKHHGPDMVIKYLKASQLAIQKKLAGTPLSSLREVTSNLPLPRLSTSGLPTIIGRKDRSLIRLNSASVIRF